jgi:dTDP-4-amino-4,6-dideoxygalactose transaminase
VTERVGHEILSLPLHSCMADEDVEAVCSAVESFFGHGSQAAPLRRSA